jgi:hypothetical protein
MQYLVPLSQNCLIKTTKIGFQKLNLSFDKRHSSQPKTLDEDAGRGVIVIFILNNQEK